jgi:hypothetical protein
MLPRAFPVRPYDFHFTAPHREKLRKFFSSLAHSVRIIATYDIFMDGLLWSILSSLAHSVTKEALWWYVAVPKKL